MEKGNSLNEKKLRYMICAEQRNEGTKLTACLMDVKDLTEAIINMSINYQ